MRISGPEVSIATAKGKQMPVISLYFKAAVRKRSIILELYSCEAFEQLSFAILIPFLIILNNVADSSDDGPGKITFSK